MKKVLLFVFSLLPMIVFASDGKYDIGEVITIGNEKFYVVFSDENDTKLLTKYNLLIGDKSDESSSNWTAISSSTPNYGLQSVLTYEETYYIFPKYGYTKFSNDGISYSGSLVEGYVNDYVEYLNTTYDLNVTGDIMSNIELESLGCNKTDYMCTDVRYSWVYNTSYWTKDNFNFESMNTIGSDNIYGNCWYGYRGFGVRPLITISNDELDDIKGQNSGDSKTIYEKVLSNKLETGSINLKDHYDDFNEEAGLYKTNNTDGGNDVYFFRGDVDNNYVLLGRFLWRIVRTNEDGSVRLVLDEGINNNAYYAHTSSSFYTSSKVESALSTWYGSYLSDYDDIIVTSDFCQEYSLTDDYSSIASALNNYSASYKCSTKPSSSFSSKIGLLSLDDVIYAGVYRDVDGTSTNPTTSVYPYLVNETVYWLLNPILGNFIGVVYSTNEIGGFPISLTAAVKPVISIKGDLLVSGSGTMGDPYVVFDTTEVLIGDDGNGTINIPRSNYLYGDKINITVSPKEGYELDKIVAKFLNNTTIDVKNNEYIVSEEDVTLYATFKKIPEYDAIIEPVVNGQVSISKTKYLVGEEVEITIVPNDGYEVDSLKVLDIDNKEVLFTNNKFIMPSSNVRIVVTFKEIVVENEINDDVNENINKEVVNPDTSNNIYNWINMFLVSMVTFMLTIVSLLLDKKINKN